MEENRFEIVESTKKYKDYTAYSLQKCNIIIGNKVVSTLTLETELNVGKHSETFFAKETEIFLRMVTLLSEKSGYPVYMKI